MRRALRAFRFALFLLTLIALAQSAQRPAYALNEQNSRCLPLDRIVSSAVLDLDATCGYFTGQIWHNIANTPADASARTAYDFYLGTTSGSEASDPTFNGSAGSAAAYFSFDGGDRFTLASGANTTFLNRLGRTDSPQDHWFLIVLRTPVADASAEGWFTNQTGTTGTGVRYGWTATEALFSGQRGDSANGNLTGAITAAETDQIFISSHSQSGNTTRHWSNSATSTETGHTYATSTADASGVAAIGVLFTDGTFPAPSGTRIYAIAMGTGYLTDTDAAKIFAAYENRHARDYTP